MDLTAIELQNIIRQNFEVVTGSEVSRSSTSFSSPKKVCTTFLCAFFPVLQLAISAGHLIRDNAYEEFLIGRLSST
jgi:hypothetical protein